MTFERVERAAEHVVREGEARIQLDRALERAESTARGRLCAPG